MDPNTERLEGVFDGLGHQRGDWDRAGFANAFDTQGVQRTGRFNVGDLDVGDLHRRRHQEIHEAGVDELPAIVEVQALVERAADSLRHATVNLALDDGRIDDDPAVVHHDITYEPKVAGQNVDLDDRGMLSAGPRRALGRKEPARL